MYLEFANGKPNSVDITFSHLGGIFTKTVTLFRRDINGTYIPLKEDISTNITCPSVSYKITDDSASENAIFYLELKNGEIGFCIYKGTDYATMYPTGTKVSMKKNKSRI